MDSHINTYLDILYQVWNLLSSFCKGVLTFVNYSLSDLILNFNSLWGEFNGDLPFATILGKIAETIAETEFAQNTTLLMIMFGGGFTLFIVYQLLTWIGNLIT